MKSISGDLLHQRLELHRRDQPQAAHNAALYRVIQQAILDGSLPAFTRLPASRDLAQELGLSRNTVLHAYDQLRAEGYLRTVTGSGTYVADVTPPGLERARTGKLTNSQTRAFANRQAPSQKSSRDTMETWLSWRGRQILKEARAPRAHWGAFVTGVPDVTQFPHRRLAQLSAKITRLSSPQLYSYSHDGGHPALREALARHLKQARGVDCDADQILITEGVHQAIDLVSRVLCDPGDVAWVEEPGYWGMRGVLAVNGLQVRPIAVDYEGLSLPEHMARWSPRLIFVTPSHQYPLGAVMGLSRRLALLEYANKRDAWIVEDDYDSEFRFSGAPIPALQGLAAHSPVVYIGTFSKTLYPGLRLAYMVLPRALAEAFRTAQGELYREGHLLLQAALAAFIDSGQYAAHIRRMRLIYAGRRACLLDLIRRHRGIHALHRYDSNAGLHLVLSLPNKTDDVAIAADAATQGVFVRPLSLYYNGAPGLRDAPRHGGSPKHGDSPKERGLLLGFACVQESEMRKPFQTLMRCIHRVSA